MISRDVVVFKCNQHVKKIITTSCLLHAGNQLLAIKRNVMMRITINTPKTWHDAIIGKRTQITPEVTQDRLIKIIGELSDELSKKNRY